MSFFEPMNEPEDEAVKTIYENLVQAGFTGADESLPMNMFTHLGSRGDLLSWYVQAAGSTLAQGKLPVTLKQMVGLCLAKKSHSEYCSNAHFKALEMLGVPKDLIDQCSSGENLDALSPVQRQVIQFSTKVAKDSNCITEDDIQGLVDIGLSSDEIKELILFIGLAHVMMIWTNVAKVPSDE